MLGVTDYWLLITVDPKLIVLLRGSRNVKNLRNRVIIKATVATTRIRTTRAVIIRCVCTNGDCNAKIWV